MCVCYPSGVNGYRVYVCVRERTHGVDGYPVDASVLRLELLQENSHAVAERLEGELAALSSGRQTDRDHRQPVLIHHRHLWRGQREEDKGQCSEVKSTLSELFSKK